MKRLLRLSLAALTFSLVTCSPPPFNLDISASARTASKLTFLSQAGPIDDTSGFLNDQSAAAAFIPERDPAGGVTTQAGFVYSWDPSSGQKLTFVASPSGSFQRYGFTQDLGPASTDPYPNAMVCSQKYSHNVMALQLDNALPSNNRVAFAQGDPALNSFPIPAWAPLNLQSRTMNDFGLGTDWVVGMSASLAAGAVDLLYLLVADPDTSGSFLEVSYETSQIGLGAFAALRTGELDLIGLGVIPAQNRYLYYYDPASTYAFAEWKDGSGWKCVKWTEFPPGVVVWQALPGLTHRIDAMLSDGQLFSWEGDTGRVYDQSGNLLAEFPLTGLRFVGEAYIGGAAQVLFSQAWRQDHRLCFNVYSIESSRLTNLGK